MQDLFYLTGSVAFNPDQEIWVGAPTAQIVDPSKVVVCSRGYDVLGQKVCVFMEKPSADLLTNWGGGEGSVISVKGATPVHDLAELPDDLRRAYQAHHVPPRMMQGGEVTLHERATFAPVVDEVFTLSHKIDTSSILDGALPDGVVLVARDTQDQTALIVMPELPQHLKSRVTDVACYLAVRMSGTEVPSNMLPVASLGPTAPVRQPQRLIIARDMKLAFGSVS